MWFVFALLSVFFTGLQAFCNKVSAEKGLDSYYISVMASAVAFVAALGLLLFSGASLAGIPSAIYWLGFASAVLYTGRTITQLESLRFIHAALFFPLYKVIGPALVTVIGIVFLKDAIAWPALIGIALSCLVPLLLISRHEHTRQKNLSLGLVLMLASTAIAAVTAAVNAYAVKPGAALAVPFLFIAYGFGIPVAIALYLRRHSVRGVAATVTNHSSWPAFWIALAIGVFQVTSFYFMLLAFAGNGLSIVYSINSHYILIPVILSVWIYKEHWNTQKAVALVLSLLALFLLHN